MSICRRCRARSIWPRAAARRSRSTRRSPRDAYRVLGYRQCGERAVRVDILERLADLIRPALAWRETSPGEKPTGAFDGRGFVVTQAMTSLTGSAGEDFASILRALGYRMDRRPPLPPKPVPVEVVGRLCCRERRRSKLRPKTPSETPAETRPSPLSKSPPCRCPAIPRRRRRCCPKSSLVPPPAKRPRPRSKLRPSKPREPAGRSPSEAPAEPAPRKRRRGSVAAAAPAEAAAVEAARAARSELHRRSRCR